jgi:hydrogenase expression/formation protein HypC
MCLALPALVVALRGTDSALVDLGGVRKEVSIALVPDVAVGAYVIVHVGYAIGTLDIEEAEATLKLFAALSAGVSP